MKQLLALTFILLTPFSVSAETVQDHAAKLVKEFTQNNKIWDARAKLVKSQAEMEKLMKIKPNRKAYCEALLKDINPHLRQDWTVKYMAWLIRNHPNLLLKAENANANHTADIDREHLFMRYFKAHHLNSMDAGEFVLSLAYRTNLNPAVEQQKIALANLVVLKHKDDRNIGLASLAQGLLLPESKEDPSVNNRRIHMFVTANDKAAEVEIEGLKVHEIIKRRLADMKVAEGKPIPFIVGIDALGKKHQISDYAGKVVMLVFWTQVQQDSELIAKRMRSVEQKHQGEDFKLIGVTRDDINSIRELRADRKVTWRNFIDTKGKIHQTFNVHSLPYCYIIDGKGFIRHRGAFGSITEAGILSTLMEINDAQNKKK